MNAKPPKPEDDKLPEAEADARFNELLGRLVNTPHKPHKGKAMPANTADKPRRSGG